MDGAPHSYYSFRPHPQWRIISIDAYDVSALGWPQDHPLHKMAMQLLNAHNPNEVRQCIRCGKEGLVSLSVSPPAVSDF